MKKKLVIASFLVALSFSKCFSQLHQKATFYGFVGVPLFDKVKSGDPVNYVFDGYKSLPYFGIIVQYSLNQHFHIAGSIRQLFNKSSNNYTISNSTLGIIAKYNFLPADKLISPFLSIEPNISFMHLYYPGNGGEKKIESDKRGDVHAMESEYTFNENRYNLFPVLGAGFAVGTDFTLKKKYGLFLSLNYYTSNSKTTLQNLESKYPDDPLKTNKSTFNYFSIQAGVKFSFFRSKAVY